MRRALALLLSFVAARLALTAPVALMSCGGEAAPDAGARHHARRARRPRAPSADAAKAEPPAKSGVEKSALDTSVSPCDDFYQYACGNWIKTTEIPGDEATWYRSFSVIRDRNEEILKGILEAKAKGDGRRRQVRQGPRRFLCIMHG